MSRLWIVAAFSAGALAPLSCGSTDVLKAEEGDAAAPAPTATVEPDSSVVPPSIDGAIPPPASCARCATLGAFTNVADIAYAIEELSGLAVSRAHADVLYGHNDSGDTPRFFAFGTDGAKHGEFAVSNATAVDWEDIGTGPCADGSPCVFIGDIGDNPSERQTGTMATPGYAIYAVKEPAMDPAGGTATVAAEKLAFLYPDGPHNAETLLVDPRSGDLFVVTKIANGTSAVYQYPKPLRPAQTVTLVKVADWLVPAGGSRELTAGDIHPCELRVVLRTYDRAFEFVDPAAKSMADLFKSTPRAIKLALEPQGEAIAYAADGVSMFTSTEVSPGDPTPIRRAQCTKVE